MTSNAEMFPFDDVMLSNACQYSEYAIDNSSALHFYTKVATSRIIDAKLNYYSQLNFDVNVKQYLKTLIINS